MSFCYLLGFAAGQMREETREELKCTIGGLREVMSRIELGS
jgi:hypothetical protein